MFDLVRDRARGGDARPEIALERRLQVAPVLDVERLVETVLLTDLSDSLGSRVFAEQRLGRRSRQESNPPEDEDRQPEQDRYEKQQPADDEASHLRQFAGFLLVLPVRPTRRRRSRTAR